MKKLLNHFKIPSNNTFYAIYNVKLYLIMDLIFTY